MPLSAWPVAEACVGPLAFGEHAAKDGDAAVDVVDDADLVFGVVVAVQAAGVLGPRSFGASVPASRAEANAHP